MDYGLERAFYNLSEQLERMTADYSQSASSSATSASASEPAPAAGALDLESELDLSGTGPARPSGATLASLRSAASLSYPRFKFLLAFIAAFLGTLLAFPGAASTCRIEADCSNFFPTDHSLLYLISFPCVSLQNQSS